MAIGQFVNPQSPTTPAPVQGPPPATPEEHAQLAASWKDYLSSPAIASGLFQFGANMLSSIGTPTNFGQRLGVAFGDAGAAAGRAQKFVTETEQTNRRLGQEDRQLSQGDTRIAQDATNAANTKAYQDAQLGLEGKRLAQTDKQNAAELALREKELNANSSYRNLSLQLQREQNALYAGSRNNPRAAALLALQKQAMAMVDPVLGDPNADVTSFIDNGMKTIDQMFPLAGGASPAPAPAATPVPGGAAPDAAAGAPNTGTAAPAATITPPPKAVEMLKKDTSPANKAHFDAIFGQGAADRILKGAQLPPPSTATGGAVPPGTPPTNAPFFMGGAKVAQ